MKLATAHATRPETAEVLSKAVRNAGRALGLSQSEVGAVIGKARSSLARPLDPESKSGELAALLVRCYRSVFVLTGGNEEAMRHWMATENRHTGGVPREQVKEVAGLIAVVGYLDAARGKL
jgi:hypothetical protein